MRGSSECRRRARVACGSAESDLGERIIAPVTRALEFLDNDWKAVLMLVAPFVTPIVRDLIPRLRKGWWRRVRSRPARAVFMSRSSGWCRKEPQN